MVDPAALGRIVSDMSRSAIEHGPNTIENEFCDACNGSGECRDDFGGEWTCTDCVPEPDPCDVPPLWVGGKPYRACDCHWMRRATLEIVR